MFEDIIDFLKEKTPSHLSTERLAICKGCDYYGKYGLCQKCGCIMAIKTRIPMMKCPIGKW